MDTLSTQEMGNFSQPLFASFGIAGRLADPMLRGMAKLSQLNSEALKRSVVEESAVINEAQGADVAESLSLHSRSIFAGGTKVMAYSAHVAEIYLTMLSEMTNEWTNVYAEALGVTTQSTRILLPNAMDAARGVQETLQVDPPK